MDLEDKTLVLTGKFSEFTRKEATARLEELGAKCQGSISKNVDILFAGENAGSKLSKASALGITVLGEQDLMQLLSVDAEQDEMSSFDGSASADALCEQLEAVDWSSASQESVDALVGALFAHQEAQGMTAAHRKAVNLLKGACRTTIMSNTPHDTDLTAWGLSPDGRYFATGAWTDERYASGGSLAIWEVATGRCVNTIRRIDGGIGWPGEQGCVQWSPDGTRVGVVCLTNATGFVNADRAKDDIDLFDDVTEGWDAPPYWCWAPDSARQFVSCWGSQGSRLAGCINIPSPHPTPPVYMEVQSDKEEKRYQGLGTLHELVWRSDQIVVGLSNDGAYAIDVQDRTPAWDRKLSKPSLSPDGQYIVYNEDGNARFIDARTGEDIPTSDLPAAEEYFWSGDGQYVAGVVRHGGAKISLYKVGELLAEMNAAVVSSNHFYRDLKPLAFSHDGSRIAFFTPDMELQIFSVGPEPQKVISVETSGVEGIFFGADDILVLAGEEQLQFVDATSGEIRADHSLFETPASVPITRKFRDSGLIPFPAGESWGYFTDEFVVSKAPDELDQALQIVVDRRRTLPPCWSCVEVFPDLQSAVQAHPRSFGDEVRKKFGSQS